MTQPTFASLMAAIVANGSAVGKAAFRAWGLTVETALNAILGRSGVIENGKLVVTASGNALTIALKTNAGNDPSSSDPVYINGFRDVTLTNGNRTTRAITAALSLTLTATATLGFVASTASGLTVGFFDNAGTVLIGVINQEASGVFTPIAVNGIASSTAEGGDGSADSAGVWYTSSALSSKAFVVAARILWTSGLATAGQWSTPTSVTPKEDVPEALNNSASAIALLASQQGAMLFKVLDANAAGGDVNTAQPWFPTAGAVTVAAGTWYKFRGILRISRAAGTTSHTTGVLFGGTASLTQINWFGRAKEGDANDLQDISGFWSLAATIQVLKAASTSATEQILIEVVGMVKINAGGTFIPQFQYSAAPGGAPSILAGSFFEMTPLGSLNSYGTWA